MMRDSGRRILALGLMLGLWGCSKEAGNTPTPTVKSLKEAASNVLNDPQNRVISMEFALKKITDAQLAPIEELSELKSLTLQECPNLTEDGLAHVATLPQLQSLELLQFPLTDQGVSRLATLKTLQNLTLARTNITGKSLDQLADLPLESLILSGKKLTGAGLTSLTKLTHLKTLRINADHLQLKEFPSLEGLDQLEVLNLRKVVIKDEFLSKLSGLPRLKVLEIDVEAITDLGLAELANCKTLEKLNLAESGMTDTGTQSLAGLGHLKELVLGRQVTDASWQTLSQLKSLEKLDAAATRMTGIGVTALGNMPNLKLFKLNRGSVNSVARQELKTFKANNPDCQILLTNSSGQEEEI